MMQVASMPLGLVLTQMRHCFPVVHILSFFQKSAAVIMIVYFTCIIDCKEWRERVHAQDKIEYSNMQTFLCQKQEIQVCIVFCTEVQYYLIFTGV